MSEWTLCSNDLAPGITSGSFFYYENAEGAAVTCLLLQNASKELGLRA